MKPRLLDRLVCPECLGALRQTVSKADGDDTLEGVLTCGCGRTYPVRDGIPRFTEDAPLPPEIRRTQKSFGYQWTRFSQMVIDFRENFLDYIRPVDASFFPGKFGLDVGCGFGRHIYNAALFGAEMVGVDISAAIDVTRQNVKHLPNVHLVQANLYKLPFRPGTFDFAYSIGVLHHIPDPERGFRSVVAVVKPRGTVFIWVYSKSRRFVNFQLETARRFTTHLPMRAQTGVTFVAAAIDWGLFIAPYGVLSRVPGVGKVLSRIVPPRIRLYSKYPFQVAWADWFDRLAAPIRFYYNEADLTEWVNRAGLEQTRISPTGLFGWRAYGEVPAALAPAEASRG